MPTYEYRCQRCGKNFDVRQNFADEPLTTHEGCGGEVERLISVPALQFKGSGFYINDYAKGGGTSPAAKDNSGEKSESKPDSKSETKSDTSSSSSSSKSDNK